MKTGKLVLALVLLISIISMSCDMYDDGIPPKAVRTQFRSMVDGARDIEWDREGQNWSVSYEIGRVEYETLYDPNGKWLVTEKEVYLSDVPQNIKAFLAASPEYGNLPFDDNTVEYYQTPSGNFYRFELSNQGRDIKVDVTEKGVVTPARYDLF